MSKSTSWPPKLIPGGNDANSQVVSNLDVVRSNAQSLLGQTTSLANKLSGLGFPSVNFPVDLDGEGQLDTLPLPSPPDIKTKDLEFNKPTTPPKMGSGPSINQTLPSRPSFDLSDRERFNPPDTTTIPELIQNTVPDAPVVGGLGFAMPQKPSLPGVDDLGEVDIDFDRFRPEFDTECIATLMSSACRLLDSPGLPPEFEEAMWNRGRDRLTRENRAQKSAIREEFSRRGWAAPSGVEMSRLDAQDQLFQSAIGDLNREIVIEHFRESLNSLRLGVQLGVQYAQVLVSAYQAYLQAASSLLTQKLQKATFRIQSNELKVRNFETEVRAEVARVGAFAQVLGLDIQAYQSRLQAIAENNAQQLRKSEFNVRVADQDWREYDSLVRQETAYYTSVVQALGLDVQTYQSEIQAHAEKNAQKLRAGQLEVEKQAQRWSEFESLVRAEIAKITSTAQAFGAKASIFGSEVSLAGVVGQRDQAKFGLETNRRQLAASAQIQKNQTEIQERRRDVDEALVNIREAVATYRQVTSALWQSISVSASIGTTRSNSVGWSTGQSYGYSESLNLNTPSEGGG